jgi:hypothetical protein
MKIALAAAAAVFVFCAGLFFSSHGLLVWSSAPAEKVGMLKCRYFTGFGMLDRQYLYTRQAVLGRDTCPRFVDIRS